MTIRKHDLSRRRLLHFAGASAIAAGFPSIIPSRALGQTRNGITKLINGDGPFISKAGCMIALEKGYFKKLGIDMEYKWFNDGGLVLAPIIAGEVDLGSLTPSAGLFNAIARGANIKMFLDGGTDLSSKHSYGVTMVSQKLWDDGVRTPADLPKIANLKAHMSVKGSFNEFLLDRSYMKGGVDPNKVTYEYGLAQPAAMQLMMKDGINITNYAYQFGWLLQKEKKAQPIAFGSDVAPGAVISNYSYTVDKFNSVGREAYVRFAMAYMAGAHLFNAAGNAVPPPEDIMAMIMKHTFFKGDAGRQMLLDIHPHWAEVGPDGHPHREGVSLMQDHWVDVRKYVEKKVDINDLCPLDVAAEAMERLKKENPFKDL
jgi:NitT/TauT family transport system substrate-binding protein